MKKVLVLLLLSASAFAQSKITSNWQPSATSGVSGYNVYRALCLGTVEDTGCTQIGPYSKIGSTAALTTFDDTGVQPGNGYVYYVTAFCPPSGCSSGVKGESDPSEKYAVLMPARKPVGISVTFNCEIDGAPAVCKIVVQKP